MTFTPAEVGTAQLKEIPELLRPEVVKGRTYIVTGANTGLGFEAAKKLVQLQAGRVILAVRSIEKGQAAKSQIEAATGHKNIAQVWQIDLSSYDSVKAFAKKVKTDLERVDGLINNAGVANGSWSEHEGLEGTVTVNVVSNLLLTVLLMPCISKSKAAGAAPRIVFVGSSGVFLAPKPLLAEINQDDIFNDLNNKGKWGTSEMNIRYLIWSAS
jgi:NAD(P)-dependent dehydrogenase (short-subunit alcohol dehydrogenase family)